ncbi:hypothetical protein [Alteribacter keqinensis]|uniref:Uncharacterized protein n=1 Tax=Alteribacter keqinensis TaxID=2483800 RepID=A0A3M7TX46_9BACI|nr:hypothetical protein [Alteribacter keqinensis]RNA70073.1 hypothetical protein EBO34_09130 [Alteribacter keqinensis]
MNAENRREEYKRNPGANVSNNVNRAMAGDPGAMVQGGCLTKVFTVVMVIVVLLLLSYFTR